MLGVELARSMLGVKDRPESADSGRLGADLREALLCFASETSDGLRLTRRVALLCVGEGVPAAGAGVAPADTGELPVPERTGTEGVGISPVHCVTHCRSTLGARVEAAFSSSSSASDSPPATSCGSECRDEAMLGLPEAAVCEAARACSPGSMNDVSDRVW